MWNQSPSFRLEINNWSEKKDILSPEFVDDGYDWFLQIFPKGCNYLGDHMSLYLSVPNSKSLPPRWIRNVRFYFSVLDQSNKELYKSPIASCVYCAERLSLGMEKTMPLSKLQEIGGLEKDKLFVEVYIKVVGGNNGDVSEKKETVDIYGFQLCASKVTSVKKIFAEHPDIAEEFKLKNQVVKTEYMNVLLNLIETLEKPPKSLLETELNKARSELSELIYVGFKLDWLKSNLDELVLKKETYPVVQDRLKKTKLEEVSLVGNKANADVQKLEERVKDLAILESQVDEVKKSCDAYVSHEERIKNLELMHSQSQLDEVFLERKKWYDAYGSQEERIKNLELMHSQSQLNEVFLERKKWYDAYGSQEERIKNLELMVSDLKVEMEKEKTKSSDDGFFLVNQVD